MPKGKKLSEFEKGKMIALSKEGLSHREIVKKHGRSRTPIDNYLKDPSKYNAKNGGGKPKVLSPRDIRVILGIYEKTEASLYPL